jgi:uncharacterized protein YbjT (DUF2867 family)
MRIAVIGGNGLIGARVVRILTAGGHDAVAHSLSTGLDLFSERGVPGALKGADVVVNLINSPTFGHASLVFFRETTENLLLAAEDAEVGHVVVLSVAGAGQVPRLPYYRAKQLQEDLVRSGPVPYSIVRATPFFEFVEGMMSWTADERTVRLPATRLQPVAAADVAWTLAEVSAGEPLTDVRTIAGPEVFALDELGRLTLRTRGDDRTVVTDDAAGMFAAVPGDTLLATGDAVVTSTTYQDWLAAGDPRRRPVTAAGYPGR